jgi:hypothetical protein
LLEGVKGADIGVGVDVGVGVGAGVGGATTSSFRNPIISECS